jgi:hypothetical protein
MKFFLKHLSFSNLKNFYLCLIAELNYSYFNAFIGSRLAAFIAGNMDTIIVIKIEHNEIIIIEDGFISEGIALRKYISSGNKLILKTSLRNFLTFSTYIENVTPKIIPNNVADVPIITPTKKNIFIIDLFNTPIDFKIAISLVLFLTNIVKPEIILKAATIIMRDKMINITFRSTFKAENKELLVSAQLYTKSLGNIF